MVCTLLGGPDEAPGVRLLSRTPAGEVPDGRSGLHGLDLEENGRLVVFASDADDLLPGDDNRRSDVYLDAGDDELVRLSDLDGRAPDGASRDPRLSRDGLWAVYTTHAVDLLPGKSTELGDIVLHDLSSGERTCVSRAPDDAEADGPCGLPDVSGDGRLVVFQSWAGNLVADDTNGRGDIFVHDRATGETRRVSVAADGAQAHGDSTHPAMSADGRFVSFSSDAPDLVPGDTNGVADVFVVELETGAIERVNVGPDDAQADAGGGLFPRSALSADGRHVAFVSLAGNLVDGDPGPPVTEQVFLRDRHEGVTTRVSSDAEGAAADDRCSAPALSDDGRFVAFVSRARNLTGDEDVAADVFVLDRRTRMLRRVSAPSHELGERDDAGDVALSGKGCTIVFASRASDQVAGDGNFASDVFVVEL